jgi:hypothetical protein
MAEHVWTVLCDKILIDPGSDKVSLIDIIETLTLHVSKSGEVERMIAEAKADGDKGILVSAVLYLVSRWTRSEPSNPEDAKFRYVFLNPSGERVHEEGYAVDLRNSSSQRAVIRFREIPVSALGRHWIIIEKEESPRHKKQPRWSAVARLPLDLTESTEPPP